MRVLLLLAFAGCGFEVTGGSSVVDGPATSSDAPVGDALPPPDARLPDARPLHVCAGYVTVAGTGTASTYKKFNLGTAWPVAKARCQQDTAHLVIPETVAEATAIHTFVNPSANSPYYWAGLVRTNGGVVDVFGAAFVDPPWASNQPNDGPADPVLVDADGKFYDYPSSAAQEFACECAPN